MPEPRPFEYRYGLEPGFLTRAAAETERLWQEHQSQ